MYNETTAILMLVRSYHFAILTSKKIKIKLCCLEMKMMVSHTDIPCIRELQADEIQHFWSFRLVVIFHELSQLELAVCLSCDINHVNDFICTWKKKVGYFQIGCVFTGQIFSYINSLLCRFHKHKVCNKAFERHSCRAANHT